MPKKTSQAAKKDTAADAKGDGPTPRRSGRAIAVKPDPPPPKDASRSRRGSTAAQTAASVADSRTPRARSGSRRESSSPSGEGRTRVKSARRSTSNVNYKESDGEEEAPVPKFDENFESGEEIDESDSDDKSKLKVRGRSAKVSPKAAAKGKGKTPAKSRRGRATKKKGEEEDENDTVEVSDDSAEVVEAVAPPPKRGRAAAAAPKPPPARAARSRRQAAEVVEVKSVPASGTKSRRSSGRATAAVKEETTSKKRPSRSSAQSKKYTEEEEEEVEEINEDKVDEEETTEKDSKEARKRKRGSSPEEGNKRLKEGEDGEVTKNVAVEEPEDVSKEDKEEEVMDVDDSEPLKSPAAEDSKKQEVEEIEEDMESDEVKEVIEEKVEEEAIPSKEKEVSSKQENVETKEVVVEDDDEEDDNDDDDVVEVATGSGFKIQSENLEGKKPEDVPIAKVPASEIQVVEPTPKISFKIPIPAIPFKREFTEITLDDSPPPAPEETPESIPVRADTPSESPTKTVTEFSKSEQPVGKKEEPVESGCVPVVVSPPSASSAAPDSAVNGSEQSSSSASENTKGDVPANPTPSLHSEQPEKKQCPRENGAHNDLQDCNNAPLSPSEEYFKQTGRVYVLNSKMNESQRQALKNQTFSFVSYNLGTLNVDWYTMKDKLFNEIGKLDPHIICLQYVGRQFFTTVMEPSLDAMGYKGIYSQPELTVRGMATFYKPTMFRFSTKNDVSLRQVVHKEIEEASSLDPADKAAVKSQLHDFGDILFTKFSTVLGSNTLTVANVQLPPTDLNLHALQVSCLAQEVVRENGGTTKPLLIGGEFNIEENDASYQLLRDGYLNNEMIEELQRGKDVVLPGKENASLVNLFWNSFQHPSSSLCSCYTTVLGREFVIPELKLSSPDLIWFNSGSLQILGVLDVVPDKRGDSHLSMKADVAFPL